MTDRRLVLRREQLADLTAGDLVVVAGGATNDTCNCPDYTYYCLVSQREVCKTLIRCY